MPTTMAGLPSLGAHERRVMLTEVFLRNQIDTKVLIGIFFQKKKSVHLDCCGNIPRGAYVLRVVDVALTARAFGAAPSEERKPQAACNRPGLLDRSSRRHVNHGYRQFYRSIACERTLMRLIEQWAHRRHEEFIIQFPKRLNSAIVMLNYR